MKTYKIFLIILCLFLWACGIKSAPIPKSSLNIPYPDTVKVSVTDEGVLIENLSDKYTMFAERSEYSRNLMLVDVYKRLSLISPNTSYLDKNVEQSVTYIYRFKNFYTEYNTFSPAVSRTIKYYVPVTIKNVSLNLFRKEICITTNASSAVKNISVNINGKDMGGISSGQECFELPNTLTINLLLIPYDFEDNPGVAYTETIKRDEDTVLLPPQNAKALRQGKTIIISWDKGAAGDVYNVYLKMPGYWKNWKRQT